MLQTFIHKLLINIIKPRQIKHLGCTKENNSNKKKPHIELNMWL
jgi:hypothetical protein